MADHADLPEAELQELLNERAEALGGDLVLDRNEDGDWVATIKRDGEVLFGAEAAMENDALILLADEIGA
jgi:hypothetical protein